MHKKPANLKILGHLLPESQPVRIKTMLFSLLLLFPSWGLADTVTLGSFYIPSLVESAQQGTFVEVARKVSAKAGYPAEIIFYPAQRTRDAFASGQLDGFFPALSQSLTQPHYASSSFALKRIYAFTRAGDDVITSLQDLRGKRIGYTLGFTYSESLLKVQEAEYQSTILEPQSVKKLLAGRIDVLLGDETSTLGAIRAQGAVHQIHYDPASPLDEHPIYFAFRNTPRGKKLAADFSVVIDAMKANGDLQQLLSLPAAVPAD